MSEIVQSSYKALLNCLYNNVTIKIPVKTRELLIQIIFLIFAFYFIVFRTKRFYVMLMEEQDICLFLGAALFMLAAVLSMRGEVSVVPWRKSIVIPYYLFALGIVGTGLMHPIGEGYGFFGLMLLSVYPCLYIVWNNRGDYEELFDRIAIAFMVAGNIYFFWFAYADFTDTEKIVDGRHEGGLFTANFLSFLGVCLSCVSLYYLYRCIEKKASKPALISSVISILMGAILISKGEGRSSMLILAASAAVVIFFIVKKTAIAENVDRKKISIVLIIALISFAVLLVTGIKLGVLQFDRFDFRNKTPEEFSSGRLNIWSNYLLNLNLLGHDMSLVDWFELSPGIGTHHAHNTFLEYSYRCGVPVGICCVAIQLAAGIITLGIMFRKKVNTGADLFVVIFSIQYLVHSLIDIATIPLTNYGTFMFYICLAPLLVAPAAKQ